MIQILNNILRVCFLWWKQMRASFNLFSPLSYLRTKHSLHLRFPLLFIFLDFLLLEINCILIKSFKNCFLSIISSIIQRPSASTSSVSFIRLHIGTLSPVRTLSDILREVVLKLFLFNRFWIKVWEHLFQSSPLLFIALFT